MYMTAIIMIVVCLTTGIDGPAAFLASESSDPAPNSQLQSQNRLQPSQSPSPSQSPTGVEPERDGDTETLLQETKTDIHELLQKQGERWTDSNLEVFVQKFDLGFRLI